jgi:MspA
MSCAKSAVMDETSTAPVTITAQPANQLGLFARQRGAKYMNAISRVLIAMVAAIAALFVSTGTSHAGLDNELSLVDGQDRTLTIQQWDTFLNGVFPLDRNRLTREWFHSGSAVYNVAGPNADQFQGTLELGYQIGFPWSLGVGINFSYTTPNILLDDVNINPLSAGFNPLGQVITPNLFPGVSISADLRSRLTYPDRTARWQCLMRTAR